MARYAMYVENPLVTHNRFRAEGAARRRGAATASAGEPATLPTWDESRALLPTVSWAGHPAATECWDTAWRLAFGNLRLPAPGTSFTAPFIDTAFGGNLFLWDSSFILAFGRWGRRAFDFQRTLDNFYACQHPDGFICREIVESTGEDAFDRFDPSATGPAIMAWAEWEHYRLTGDRVRLEAVLPPLLAFHRWMRTWRTWPDGSYWATGWACGMDNQPRMPAGNVAEHNHGHMSWLDTCAQQALSARLFLRMRDELGASWPVDDMRDELAALERFVNTRLWSERDSFYYDLWPDGTLNGVKSIGAYWALLAGIVPGERLARFVDHLENPAEFNRPHRVPSLSADHPLYRPGGDYWRGSVWAPANYMVLKALQAAGHDDLAHRIALNHVTNVHAVFEQTGTVWENYAPESVSRGEQSAPDFVGWTGLPPIAVLLEFVFGLRPEPAAGRLAWDLRLPDAFSVGRIPFGSAGELTLASHARASAEEPPVIDVASNVPVTIELSWPGGHDVLRVAPGRPARKNEGKR